LRSSFGGRATRQPKDVWLSSQGTVSFRTSEIVVAPGFRAAGEVPGRLGALYELTLRVILRRIVR